jgi:hypothetical protein
MEMKAPRIAAPLPEVSPTLLCGNIITQHRRILTVEIAPVRLVKIRGEKGTSE